jgi:hypothetical protein
MLIPAGHAAAKGNDGAALRFLASVWAANPKGFRCIAVTVQTFDAGSFDL